MNINMKELFNKIKKLDLSKWVLTKMYCYTSSVRDIIARYETWPHENGDKYIKDLYDHFVRIANIYKFERYDSGYGCKDNKTTIEITNIETGEKLYIGMYDDNYSLGKDYWSEFGNYYEFGYIGNKKS